MKITLDAIGAGTIPVAALRTFVAPYGDRDLVELPREEAYLVAAAMETLLQPMPGTPAALLQPALGGMVNMIPLQTVHGATLASVTRNWVARTMGNGQTRHFNHLTFAYDDGVRTTEWADHGDHGATLVLTADGRPAFYTTMTSDGYFDSMIAADEAGISFSIVDRLEELDDRYLCELVGDIDPRRLAALPRLGRQSGPPAKPAQEGMTLRQLYAAPPSPSGRARLGRRA